MTVKGYLLRDDLLYLSCNQFSQAKFQEFRDFLRTNWLQLDLNLENDKDSVRFAKILGSLLNDFCIYRERKEREEAKYLLNV